MPVLIVDQNEVRSLLTMPACIEAMVGALTAVSAGEALLPVRTVLRLPGGQRFFGAMPAYLDSLPALGIKVLTVMLGNHGTPLDSHQGATLLFDTTDGRLLCILDATSITAIRTAAVSGVATRALARRGAGDLAVLGAGVQARTHIAAMAAVLSLRRVRVWSRSAEGARQFAAAAVSPVPVEPCATAREAVEGADVICTVTSSPAPVLSGAWIAPGAHINAVGASRPETRELDSDAVARARLYVDSRAAAMVEAGEFLIPRSEGRIDDRHVVGEIGEVLLGRILGRQAPEEITLFKSLGLAVEDVAAARLIYDRARSEKRGIEVEIGGRRE
ncbi:MAG TPA: ornithine cyclodeaminase family protein [Gemmatimonadaceae bacterium]|nr:ornithine cyclodeaminase family protein [Gemmatimonadaceae bacterium]